MAVLSGLLLVVLLAILFLRDDRILAGRDLPLSAVLGRRRGLLRIGDRETRELPLEIPASDSTRRYLKTKKEKLGHKLSSV